jgi:hypothetical protein
MELTFEEKQSRSDLIHKLNQSKIRAREAKELRTILNREKQIISLQGNYLAFFAVTFLIGYVEDYLGVNVSEA